MWCEAGHQVLALRPPRRGRPTSAVTYTLPGTTGMSYRVICRWLLFVLGLEKDQAVNQFWLPLEVGLGTPSESYGAPKSRCYLFQRF